jgi:hypothetical protein
MDKQFMRILMLSVLLPAGAALGQAIQQKHLSFPAADHELLSLEVPSAAKKPVAGAVRTVAAHRDITAYDRDGQRRERRLTSAPESASSSGR